MLLTGLLDNRPPSASDAAIATLRHRLPELFAGVYRTTPIVGLAPDSFDLVELLCVVEDEFGVRLGTEDFARLRTVGDLGDLIAERGGNGETR